jgi:hypothetical protein
MSRPHHAPRTFRLALFGGVLLLGTALGRAQSTTGGTIGNPTTPQTSHPGHNGEEPPDPFAQATRERLEQERATGRQRQLVHDTERLLALANQLKAEVAASGAESMTPEMLRQMDEIEKLARSVKEKMKG